jgi:transposase
LTMNRLELQQRFEERVKSVRSRRFEYVPKKASPREWRGYNIAQEREIPEVIGLVASIIEQASSAFPLPKRHDAVGREPYPKRDLAKLILAQQYDARCNRVSIGLLSMFKAFLKVRCAPSYKVLERAYDDPDVVALLNEAFFLTQLPVKDLEHEFALDGTCDPTTIKENWESSKDEILRLAGKKSSGKERERHTFEKTVLAVGTTFKIIASFARTRSPFSNESPYLKPLLNQVGELYAFVLKVCIDSAYLSRENCDLIEKSGAMPRILPKTNSSMKAKGSGAWKRMMIEFVEDTQKWLREYHSRSIIETVNSTMKRLFGPLMKRLVERKATEILARMVVYNIRQLIYLKYTKGLVIENQAKPNHQTLMDWISP